MLFHEAFHLVDLMNLNSHRNSQPLALEMCRGRSEIIKVKSKDSSCRELKLDIVKVKSRDSLCHVALTNEEQVCVLVAIWLHLLPFDSIIIFTSALFFNLFKKSKIIHLL